MSRKYIFVIIMSIFGASFTSLAEAKSLRIKRLYPVVSIEIPADGGLENNEVCPRYKDFLIAHSQEMMDQVTKDPALAYQTVKIGLEETPVRKVHTQVNESTGVFKIEIENEPAVAGTSVKRVVTGELGKNEAKMNIVVFSGGFPEPICRIVVRQNIETEIVN